MSGTREENVFMARLAEQSQRYEDMITYMTRVANMGSELSEEERNLLAVGFKNSVGAGRQALRMVRSLMQKEDPASPHLPAVNRYKEKIEGETRSCCDQVLALLRKDDGLIRTASTAEAQVFYLKMEGDYHRYLAEFSEAAAAGGHAQNAFTAYDTASKSAAAGMEPEHPIRLGLALNFSVFYYEVYGKAAEACALARAAYEEAIPRVESSQWAQDSASILQLIRDNLVLWQTDLAAQQGGEKPPEQDGTLCEDM